MAMNPLGAFFMCKEGDFRQALKMLWLTVAVATIPYLLLGHTTFFRLLAYVSLITTLVIMLITVAFQILTPDKDSGDMSTSLTGVVLGLVNLYIYALVGINAIMQLVPFSFYGITLAIGYGAMVFTVLIWSGVQMVNVEFIKSILDDLHARMYKNGGF